MTKTSEHTSCRRHRDRGISILIVAVSMIFILGMAGLGIDLASLYVGRSQAQRAADAAALAAANYLASPDSACLTGDGGTLSSTCEALAIQRAEAVGNNNLIAGVSPNIQDGDVTFLSASANDPQVQVVAARDAAHGNPMPTFFVKIFGIDTANVSAKAVAEAYTPDSSGPPVGARCVKPWLIPNCDPGNLRSVTGQYNQYCGSSPEVGGFVDVTPGSYASVLARPDGWADSSWPSDGSGPKGEPFTLKPGSPSGAAAPGQYYAAYIPNDTLSPTVCPACAKSGGGSGNGTGSAAVYRENIECCNQNAIVCGPNAITLQSTAGNMVGPTSAGVDCLIHQAGNTSCGQDYLEGVSNPPCVSAQPPPLTSLKIIAGPNYPYGDQWIGKQISSTASDSVVALPIWDGNPLQSGQNPNIVVVGFLQLFIQNEDSTNQGTVYGTVMGVTACGGGGSGSGSNGGPIIAPGGSTVPVRLIHE